MATHKPSPHTRYRYARARLADLEALRAALERTRPRTRGKKAARTRALNKLARQIPAAKGLLTKARNAIAKDGTARIAKSVGSSRTQRGGKAWVGRTARTEGFPAGRAKSQHPLLQPQDAVPHARRASSMYGHPPKTIARRSASILGRSIGC